MAGFRDIIKARRFSAVKGSVSAHCCFAWSVVDADRATTAEGYAVCECYEEEDARRIADALNATELQQPEGT